MSTFFYRVQSDQSFTIYSDRDGFDTHRYYQSTRYSCWINKHKFESHLHWGARPPIHRSTPFISVFDNPYDAEERAERLVDIGHTGVFVAKIEVPRPRWFKLRTRSANSNVDLPVLAENRYNNPAWFISTRDVRRLLGVNVQTSQLSEWFAVNFIPDHLIVGYRDFW